MERGWVMLAALALALAGCVRVTSVTGPDGHAAFVLRCGPHDELCYSKAGELCPQGYAMLDSSSGFAIVPVNHSIVGASRRTMLIECK